MLRVENLSLGWRGLYVGSQLWLWLKSKQPFSWQMEEGVGFSCLTPWLVHMAPSAHEPSRLPGICPVLSGGDLALQERDSMRSDSQESHKPGEWDFQWVSAETDRVNGIVSHFLAQLLLPWRLFGGSLPCPNQPLCYGTICDVTVDAIVDIVEPLVRRAKYV